MATSTTLIQSVTVPSGGASSIDFTSIPGTYTDLCLKVSARTDNTAGGVYEAIKVTFNGSSAGYADILLYGSGSGSASSANQTGTAGTRYHYATSDNATASTFGNTELYIPNYAGSNYKSLSSDSTAENNATATYMGIDAGLWSNSAAITSIKIITNSAGLFKQYSTAYLYGIKNS